MKAKIMMLIVILFAISLAGCSTINGAMKDIETASAWGSRVSQNAVDKQAQAKKDRAFAYVLSEAEQSGK